MRLGSSLASFRERKGPVGGPEREAQAVQAWPPWREREHPVECQGRGLEEYSPWGLRRGLEFGSSPTSSGETEGPGGVSGKGGPRNPGLAPIGLPPGREVRSPPSGNGEAGACFWGCLARKLSFCAGNPKNNGAWFRSMDLWVMSPTRQPLDHRGLACCNVVTIMKNLQAQEKLCGGSAFGRRRTSRQDIICLARTEEGDCCRPSTAKLLRGAEFLESPRWPRSLYFWKGGFI